MATQVQFRRGTTTQNNAFTGAVGELTYDTDIKTLRIHDGSTAGGGAVVVTLAASQTLTNKTLSTGSSWSGNAIGLSYGGTGSALTAVSGAIAYSTGSAIQLSAAGTSGQILISGGTGAPTWINASSLTTGTATTATTATNIAGGSAGQLIIQQDTGLTTFITAGASGTFLKSAGAGYAPQWATGDVTIGTTTIALGSSSTTLVGMSSITFAGSTSGTAQLKASAVAGTGTVITMPATTGTLITTGDTGTVTSTMIADGTIVNADINASAAIALTKLASDTTTALGVGTIELGHATDTTIARSAAGVVTIEGVEVVTLSRTQTLTNKTLTLPTIGGTGAAFSGSTSGTTTLLATAVAGTTTLTLPAATDTLVGKATTDTLTNKTIAAGSNTISGLTNSNLSGSAGITNANLANSSVTIGTTAISLGASSTTIAGLTSIDATSGSTSFFATPTAPAAFAGATTLTLGYSGTAASTTNISTGAVATATTKTINIGTGGATGSTTNVNLGSSTGGTTTVNNDLVVTGNLTINGTTTTVNATTITVDDINIELGSIASPTDVTAAGGGITLKGATDKTISWSAANGWTSSEDLNVASGKIYRINGTSVLSATTLGSGVTASSLTSVGTITSGTWSGSFGAVSGANLTSLTAGNLTGTIPSAVLGNSTVYIGTTAVALNRASANLALTGILSETYAGSTSGTIQVIPTAVAGTNTLTLPAVTGTFVTTGDTGTVTSTMIADGTIVNADINASAAIAVSKLAASTISGVTLGNNLNTLTIGTGLSGTSYNGSAAVTIAIDSTVVTLTGTQTLTNKTLTAPVIGATGATFNGSTSGTAVLSAPAVAGTATAIVLPSTAGTLIGTGDTGTVTNAMLAGSIATSKITGLAASATTDTTNASNISSGTLGAGRLPAFTGDATSTAGTSALTLATVNSNTGSFGSSTSIPVITVNGKGLVTAVSTATVTSLPSQTGNAGKYLTTDGTNASWATISLTGYATASAGLQQFTDAVYQFDKFTYTTSTSSAEVVYTIPIATYRSAELTIQMGNNASNYRIMKVLLVHNGTTVTASENYVSGTEVQTANTNTTMSYDISGGNIRVLATVSTATTVFKGTAMLYKV